VAASKFYIKRIAAGIENISIYCFCPLGLQDNSFSVWEKRGFAGEYRELDGTHIYKEIALLNDNMLSFCFCIQRNDSKWDRIYSAFRLQAVTQDGSAETAEGPCYVTEFDNISLSDYDYPRSHTIKGLQVNMVDDALKLGIGHAALNLNLPGIMIPEDTGDAIKYQMEGETFFFHRLRVEAFDRKVKELSDNGVAVTLILLNSKRWDGVLVHQELEQELIHPDYDPEGFISAFPVVTERGLKRFRAFVEFAAERYTRPDQRYGRACGYMSIATETAILTGEWHIIHIPIIFSGRISGTIKQPGMTLTQARLHLKT